MDLVESTVSRNNARAEGIKYLITFIKLTLVTFKLHLLKLLYNVTTYLTDSGESRPASVIQYTCR